MARSRPSRGRQDAPSQRVDARFQVGILAALMAAELRSRPLLGREVTVGRWTVIEGENSREDVIRTYLGSIDLAG